MSASAHSAIGTLTRQDAQSFLTTTWGRDLLYTNATGAHRELLGDQPLSLLDDHLSSPAFRPDLLRVVKSGEEAPTSDFTRRRRNRAGTEQLLTDPAKLLRLLNDSHTVVIGALHAFQPGVASFVRRLAAELGHPVGVNAYLTPEHSQGLNLHYDTHDVFVVQVHGSKRWTVRRPSLQQVPAPEQEWALLPKGTRHSILGEGQEAEYLIDMRPGDCLYLPRGFLHAAQTTTDVSVHLTLAVYPILRRDLVHSLLDAVVPADSWLRHESAPTARGSAEDVVLELRTALERLSNALDRVDPQALIDGCRGRAATDAPASPIRVLEALDTAARLEEHQSFQIRPDLAPSVQSHSDRLTVSFGETTLSMPPIAAEALDRIVAGEAVTASALASATLRQEHAEMLLRTLARRGFVALRP